MCETAEFQKIIDELNGSSDGLQSYLIGIDREDLQDNPAFTALLDSQIFQCEECGWWCPVEDSRENEYADLVCQDCSAEE